MLSYQNLPARKNRAFTLLEAISIALIISAIAGFVFTWVSKQQLKAKTVEAPAFMKQIFNAEVAYYEKSQTMIGVQVTAGKSPINNKIFLSLPALPPSPTTTPQYTNFSEGDWALLGIKRDTPVYFSYSVEAKGTGNNATFSVIARGDLDGDQRYSRYEMFGRINVNGQVLGKDSVYSLDSSE